MNYFRRHFEVTQNHMNTLHDFKIEMVVDDGAVVYFNGQRMTVFNVNTDDKPPNHNSLAKTNVRPCSTLRPFVVVCGY